MCVCLCVRACRFNSQMPAVHATKGREKVEQLGAEVSELVRRYIDCMDRIKLREGIKTAMTISAAGNKFFQASHPPDLHASAVPAAGMGNICERARAQWHGTQDLAARTAHPSPGRCL